MKDGIRRRKGLRGKSGCNKKGGVIRGGKGCISNSKWYFCLFYLPLDLEQDIRREV
jgi:hypothetical protein